MVTQRGTTVCRCMVTERGTVGQVHGDSKRYYVQYCSMYVHGDSKRYYCRCMVTQRYYTCYRSMVAYSKDTIGA